ncbi:hypothetical protein C8R44DRAFT_883317 [Mycena epipterygia]|nr:hypothetical protein C8R44DRAFT_883317 [Mycena epipterygia]
MGVSNEQYETLKTASTRFLSERDFSFPEIEIAMDAIFGEDRSSPEAQAWKKYWADLAAAEEIIGQGNPCTLPALPGASVSDRDIDMDSGTQPMLSNAALNSDEADRAHERAERKKNGNQHGKQKKDVGRGFDELMASVFIVRTVLNRKHEMKPMYYCIGCDSAVRNGTRKRNTAHMLQCKPLQRDFPATWKQFKAAVNGSAEEVASGEVPAPALQTKKIKLEDAGKGRMPIPGITTPLPDSQSQDPSQRTLDDTWGASSITATRQSTIDYLLLRLIVCCGLAFSLCDNGFFIDFCNALCPSYSVPDRSNFITYNLVAETENAMKQLKDLESFVHLTLSFDGWSSRRSDEIYTVHVSTPTRMSSGCRDHFDWIIDNG